MKRIVDTVRGLGPYAALELLVPGGSVLALALWTFRNRARLSAPLRRLLH